MRTRTVVFPFGHYAEVKRAKQRLPRSCRFKSAGGVAIETVGASELVTAFRIEEPQGRGRRCYPIYCHAGRLWWPLYNPLAPDRDERQTLEDAIAGRVNLFGDEVLDASPEALIAIDDDPSIVATGVSDEKEVHADIQKRARDLLLVGGDRLFAAGGRPVIVTWSRRLRVVNTGATRSGEPTRSGLALQPGHHGDFGPDWAMCLGKFWNGPSAALDDEICRLRCRQDRVPIIDQFASVPDTRPDFELQLDAAYRRVDDAVYRVEERPNSYGDLMDLLDGARADATSNLTARRLKALHGCARILGEGWVLDTFPLGCGKRVLELLKNAPAELLSTEAGLSHEDGDALARV